MRIDAIWQEISRGNALPAFRRISETHPLDIYIGIDEDSRPLLLLLSHRLVTEVGSFQSLKIERARREDGLWSYTLVLEDMSLRQVFSLLCEDLVASTEVIEVTDATQMFFARLKRWRTLLATGSSGLAEEEVRGLLAELHVMSQVLAPAFGIGPSALGWAGPEAEEQDFRISGRAFEVKSTAVGKTRVKIASIRQLDYLTGPLDLLVVTLSPSSTDRGTSLKIMVESIREMLSSEPIPLGAFETKLALAGFTPADPAIERCYTISATRRFEIDAEFPCLTPSQVPVGVVEAAYTIDLSLCHTFERPLPV